MCAEMLFLQDKSEVCWTTLVSRREKGVFSKEDWQFNGRRRFFFTVGKSRGAIFE